MSFAVQVDEQIRLRFCKPEHAEELFAVIDANRAHLRKWLPWVDGINTVDDERKWIGDNLTRFVEGGVYGVNILYQGQIAGNIGFALLDMENRVADIGYWLAESMQGHGIMTRACRAWVSHCFDTLKLHRATIRAEPANERSWRIAERLGFTREGTLRHVGRYDDGRWIDHHLYAMLAEDWPQHSAETTT